MIPARFPACTPSALAVSRPSSPLPSPSLLTSVATGAVHPSPSPVSAGLHSSPATPSLTPWSNLPRPTGETSTGWSSAMDVRMRTLPCSGVHRKLKATATHQQIALEDALAGNAAVKRIPRCQKHTDLLIFVCDCDLGARQKPDPGETAVRQANLSLACVQILCWECR